MLKIGDFARLAQVPVKTLRHYDELGLITPARVDEANGYRYYSVEQLPRLNRVLALKDLGFSLDQIAQVLNEGVSHEQLRGMLMLKRAEAAHRSREEHERMARIEARLRDIEGKNNMLEYDVVLKRIAPMLVASRRVRIATNAAVPEVLGAAYDEVYAHIRSHAAKSLDPCMALWHTSADTYEDEDAEAIVPVSASLPEGEHVRVYELAGGTMASAVHHGEFAEFTKLHPAVLRWIEANGYEVAGPSREIYIQNDSSAPGSSVTEVQYPVTKA